MADRIFELAPGSRSVNAGRSHHWFSGKHYCNTQNISIIYCLLLVAAIFTLASPLMVEANRAAAESLNWPTWSISSSKTTRGAPPSWSPLASYS